MVLTAMFTRPTMMSDDFEDWMREEAGLGADSQSTPQRMTAAEGITSMENRIQYLENQKNAILVQYERGNLTDEALNREMKALNSDLATARTRLTEYRTQQQGLN